jgi:hypothetical protein
MSEVKGLKKLRAKTGAKPEIKCENCKCLRFSKCGCMVGMKKAGRE